MFLLKNEIISKKGKEDSLCCADTTVFSMLQTVKIDVSRHMSSTESPYATLFILRTPKVSHFRGS